MSASELAFLRQPAPRAPSRPRRVGRVLGAIGATIREARKRKGLTQVEVASSLAVSPRAYQAWERGSERVPSTRAPMLCDVLGLPHDEICRADLVADTPDEVALLSGFRAASEDERRAALAAVCP